VVAYYLGIFALIPCLGLLLSVPALVLGILGLRKAARQPEVKGKVHAWAGIVLGGVIFLAYVVFVLAVVVIPALRNRPPY
jgi:hypothetical protein